MKTTLIRVTRVSEFTVTEHFDVPIVQEDDAKSYSGVVTIATNLVEAMIEAGATISWVTDSKKSRPYPTPKITGEAVEAATMRAQVPAEGAAANG